MSMEWGRTQPLSPWAVAVLAAVVFVALMVMGGVW